MTARQLRDLLNKPEMEQFLDCDLEFEDQLLREYNSIKVVALTHEHFVDDDIDEQRLTLSSRLLTDENNKFFSSKRTILYQQKEEE